MTTPYQPNKLMTFVTAIALVGSLLIQNTDHLQPRRSVVEAANSGLQTTVFKVLTKF